MWMSEPPTHQPVNALTEPTSVFDRFVDVSFFPFNMRGKNSVRERFVGREGGGQNGVITLSRVQLRAPPPFHPGGYHVGNPWDLLLEGCRVFGAFLDFVGSSDEVPPPWSPPPP